MGNAQPSEKAVQGKVTARRRQVLGRNASLMLLGEQVFLQLLAGTEVSGTTDEPKVSFRLSEHQDSLRIGEFRESVQRAAVRFCGKGNPVWLARKLIEEFSKPANVRIIFHGSKRSEIRLHPPLNSSDEPEYVFASQPLGDPEPEGAEWKAAYPMLDTEIEEQQERLFYLRKPSPVTVEEVPQATKTKRRRRKAV